MKMTKKILAIVLSVIMILSVFAIVPFTAFAHPDYLWLYANDENVSLLNNYNYGTGSTVGGAGVGSKTQKVSDMKAKGFVDAINTPNVTYYIYAENAGTYSSLVSFNVGGSALPEGGYKMVIGVNDKKFYEGAPITTAGWIAEQEIMIDLEKGINVVRILPHVADNYVTTTWVDVNSFNLPKGVGIENKTGEFKANCINGGAGQVQGYTNFFNSIGTNLGGIQGGTMRSEKITFATMDTEALKNIPYYSVTVNVPYDGYYSIMQTIGTPGTQDATAYFAYAVDGKFYRGGFNTYGGGNRTYATAYMTKGVHTITITGAYDYVGTYNGSVVSNDGSTAFDWNDLQNVYIPGVTRAETQIDPQTIAPQTNVLYADDSAWYANGSVSTTEKAYGTRSSGDHWLVGGFNTNGGTFDTISKGQFKANEAASINYQVKVDKAGTYDITVINQVATGTTTNAKDSGYFATVSVNDKTFVKAPFTPYYLTQAAANCWSASTVSVTLEEGVNVIRVYPRADDAMTNISGWINFGGIKVDGPGTATAVTSAATGKKTTPSQQVQFGDSTLTNKYLNVTAGGNVGGVQYGDAFSAGITYDTLSLDNLATVPYVAYKVTVPEAGYYDFQLATNYGANNSTTNGLPYIAAMTSAGAKTKICKYQATGYTNSRAAIKLPKGTTTVYFVPPLADHFTSVAQWFDFGTLYSYGGATLSSATVLHIDEYKPGAIAEVEAKKLADDPAEVEAVIAEIVAEIDSYTSTKTYTDQVADIDNIVAGADAKIADARTAAFDAYKTNAVATVNGFTGIYADAASEITAGVTAVNAVTYDAAKSYSANIAAVDAAVATAMANVEAALTADKATFENNRTTVKNLISKLAVEGDSAEVTALINDGLANADAYTFDASKTLAQNRTAIMAIRTETKDAVDAQRAAEEEAIAAIKAAFESAKAEAVVAVDALNKETNSAAMNEIYSDAADRLAALAFDESLTLDENRAAIKAITDDVTSKLSAAEKAIADQLHVWTQYQKNITAASDEAYVRFFFELDTNTNNYEDFGFYVTIDGLFENEKMSFYGAELDAIAGLQTPDVYDYSGKANKFVYAYFVLPNEMFGLDITVQAYFTDAAGEQLGEVKTANVATKYNLG